MSYIYSQALEAAYSQANCSDTNASVPLNAIPTPRPSLWHGKTIKASLLSRYGMTCELLTADHGEGMNTNTIALDALKETYEALCISYPLHSVDSDKRFGIMERARAAIAALEAEPQGWRPIETAPKDGAHILLSNGATVAEGWWEHQEPYIREKRDIDGRYIDQEESDGFDDWLDCQGGMQPDPTHWMPLPNHPKE